MNLIRMAAIAAAATILSTATAPAGPLNLSRPQLSNPDRPVELANYHHVHHYRHVYHHRYTHRRHYYRSNNGAAVPMAIIGGIIGGAVNNGCYFNDCGYGYGGGYDGG